MASAVVLPAHGPPVTHMRVIGVFVFCLASFSFDALTIGSSRILLLLAIDSLSSKSLLVISALWSILIFPRAEAYLTILRAGWAFYFSEKLPPFYRASFNYAGYVGDLSPPYSEPAYDTEDKNLVSSWTIICLETLSRSFFSRSNLAFSKLALFWASHSFFFWISYCIFKIFF